MVCSWITFLLIFTVLLTCFYVGVDAQSLSDKDVTKEVLHRLDELERQVKEQHSEIEKLRGENVELKSLRKYDSDILRGQNVELDRLRKVNIQLEKQIDFLKDRDTQLVARINIIENQNKALEGKFAQQPSVVAPTDVFKTKFGSNDTIDVKDVKTDDGTTTDDKSEIVSESQGKAVFSRIRRQSEQGQTIAFFATRSSSHAEHLGQHQNVVFDRAVTNIGHGYHNSTGIFTAPVSGVYVFSTTIFTANEDAHFNFVINGQRYTMMYAHNTEVHETMSQTVIFNLAKGDDVAIQSLDLDKMVYGYDYSTFSGFLLVSTEDTIIVG